MNAPLDLRRGAVVRPPFIMLAIGAVIAFALGDALASDLHGDWINLEATGYLIAWGGYCLFAGIFLWIDARAARRLPGLIYPGRLAMWKTTILLALAAAVGALFLGSVIMYTLLALGTNHFEVTVEILGAVVPCGVVSLMVSGAIRNVRARRSTTIVEPPF